VSREARTAIENFFHYRWNQRIAFALGGVRWYLALRAPGGGYGRIEPV
jgi:hypothetical protein